MALPIVCVLEEIERLFGALSQSSTDVVVFVVIWHCSQWDSANLPFPLSPLLVPSVYYSM